MTVFEIKKQLEQTLGRADALELLKFVLGTDASGVLMRLRQELSPADQKTLFEYAGQMQNGRPLQYILGCWEFCGLEIRLNENVLIPRADTELLAQTALELCDSHTRVIDLCTGSGCIAAVLAQRAGFVTAVDLFDGALGVASQNLSRLAKSNYEVIKADVLSKPPKGLEAQYDILVSNPPYIRRDVIPTLDKNVQSEPLSALDGGEDGLDFYRQIITHWKSVLLSGGKMLLEIGFDQALSVTKLMQQGGFEDIKVLRDSGENDRVIIGTLKT